MRVAILTDNDFGKANGVTTTLRAVVRHAPPNLSAHLHALGRPGRAGRLHRSLGSGGLVPFYAEMRMHLPPVRRLARQLADDGMHLVHVTTPGPAGLAAKYLAARLGLPLVGSFHTHRTEHTTMLSGSARLGGLMNVYMRWLYGSCRQLLVPSRDAMARLNRDGWGASRLTLWPRGVDAEVFSPLRRSRAVRESWGASDRRPVMLYVGRLSREKGLGMIAAVEGFLRQRGIDVRVVIAGDGPMAAVLKTRCPEAHFLGQLPHDQVAVVMASADLFLFPSDTDTAGNVVLEAQASGLPVLVSRLAGPREQIRDGETGFVCEAGEAVDFARRAAQVLTEPDRRKAMSAAARAHARTRTWDHALVPLFDCYRRAVLPACDGGSTAPLSPAGVAIEPLAVRDRLYRPLSARAGQPHDR